MAEESVRAFTKERASEALEKAVRFYREQVSAEGGYLWRYSADLARREGEGKATDSMVWVQFPGTPAVGNALLRAFESTGGPLYLELSRDAAHALVRGQLRSGGWDYRIHFHATGRRGYNYRVEPPREKANNTSTLDDDNTQSALRYLMRMDKTLAFKDERIHEAVQYGLERLLEVQYPNGAFPQRYKTAPDPEAFPVKRAAYPESWPRAYAGHNYTGYYTFNDNTIADVIRTLFLAAETYGDARYREAAKKAGDFILLAQMPEPQPAWAQQYDAEMHPAWARKFEPPAVTGGESQGVMRVLLDLFRKTGEQRYLEPIPRALEYLRASRLPDGRLARFYELRTNTPLYFTKDYQLTYSSDDMPTHYGFITSDTGLDTIEAEYQRLRALPAGALESPEPPRAHTMNEDLARRAQAAASALDARGAWVEDGRLKYHGPDDPTRRIIDSRTFIDNVGLLSQFIAAAP